MISIVSLYFLGVEYQFKTGLKIRDVHKSHTGSSRSKIFRPLIKALRAMFSSQSEILKLPRNWKWGFILRCHSQHRCQSQLPTSLASPVELQLTAVCLGCQNNPQYFELLPFLLASRRGSERRNIQSFHFYCCKENQKLAVKDDLQVEGRKINFQWCDHGHHYLEATCEQINKRSPLLGCYKLLCRRLGHQISFLYLKNVPCPWGREIALHTPRNPVTIICGELESQRPLGPR